MDTARTTQLKTFANRVPSGKIEVKKTAHNLPTVNLASEPSPPPMNIAKMEFKWKISFLQY